MIAEILPAEVSAAEAFEDSDPSSPFPEEEREVCRAVERRRREFFTGRECARRALSYLGLAPAPIPRGPHGAPCWPPGVVGSITHCDGYRASAVTWSGVAGSIGIDAEPNAPLPPRVLNAITLEAERGMLDELTSAAPRVRWDRLLFSAKEAVFKTWCPLTGGQLGFRDAEIGIRPQGGFTAHIPPVERAPDHTVGPSVLAGRWLADGGLLLTAIVAKPELRRTPT